MKVFTVKLPGGTKEYEFQTYKSLLEEAGVDISKAPRIQEVGTSNRWLYVWHERLLAERFARELKTRSRNGNWEVYEFELPHDEFGPLAPLDIIASFRKESDTFWLSPASQERIMRHFPNARLSMEVSWSRQTREDYERRHGPIWNRVAIELTGLSEKQVAQLGGYRVIQPDGLVLYQPEMVAI